MYVHKDIKSKFYLMQSMPYGTSHWSLLIMINNKRLSSFLRIFRKGGKFDEIHIASDRIVDTCHLLFVRPCELQLQLQVASQRKYPVFLIWGDIHSHSNNLCETLICKCIVSSISSLKLNLNSNSSKPQA
jgi:hypothetical protein